MPDPISWSHSLPYLMSMLAFGYVLGSIPFGLLLTKMAGLGDIRNVGSGNIGATNVLRTGKKWLAALTLILDAAKGAVAVLIASLYGPDTAVVAGFGAFIGHCFPIWLKFKGGKGVATYLGILIAFSWKAGLVFGVVWLASAFISRYSSLSALLATVAVPVALYFTSALVPAWISNVQLAELFVVLGAILWFRHRENITRLLNGSEGKIGKS